MKKGVVIISGLNLLNSLTLVIFRTPSDRSGRQGTDLTQGQTLTSSRTHRNQTPTNGHLPLCPKDSYGLYQCTGREVLKEPEPNQTYMFTTCIIFVKRSGDPKTSLVIRLDEKTPLITVTRK